MPKLSAGTVSNGFWFPEFTQLMAWVNEGDDDATIKRRVVEENTFKQRTRDRAARMTACLLRRIHSLPAALQEDFAGLDLDNQRVLVLVGIMNTDQLVQQFMLDCFRSAVVMGDQILQSYELDAFFLRLQGEREEVAGWQDETITRLKGTLRNYLRGAGLVTDADGQLVLRRPLLSSRVVAALQDAGHADFVIALTGRANG
ncbi:DUF1819 family protein [Lacticaseibacillus kribbianus]|uniref:DUF1819 family protein n=1 Tax=Lacticaseibacillus kribbianus TaxID=2926292 RepID=UPI001CD1A934|nr:DUF1819 family protein [Lacticaseibacillus kribbianus]